MNKQIKLTLMNAVVSEPIKTVQNLLKEHQIQFDDSYFDYDLLKAALHRNVLGIVKILLKVGCRIVNPNSSKEESLLHIAIKNVRSFTDEIVRELMKKGASIFDKNVKGETPVYTAFKAGAHSVLNILLRDYHSIRKSKDDLLHFHIACIINQHYVAERYLKCGIDPNLNLSLDSDEYAGLNPIQLAIDKNYFKLFATLIEYNGDLSIKNDQGLTPLHQLYYSNLLSRKIWIQEAFRKGNDKKFIITQDKYRVTFFHLCCMINEPKFVQVFIDNGVNINNSVSSKCPINPGFTALHFAVQNGCIEVIKLLLKNGADPNKSDVEGKIPLHLTFKITDLSIRHEIMIILVGNKTSAVFADKKGSTPLHEAFYCVSRAEFNFFDTLISKVQWGSDNITDKQGLSLFHIACTTEDVNQVTKFLKAGVNVDSPVTSGMYSGFTALHFAVMYNHIEIVKILLKNNAKVNAASELGVTPLHLACEFNFMKFQEKTYDWMRSWFWPVSTDLTTSRTNQIEILKLLLSHGSDVNVNAKDSLGITPLMHACMIDKNYFKLDWTYSICENRKEKTELIKEIKDRLTEIVEILISNEADVKAQTKSKSSVLHIICKYNNLQISEKLMKLLILSGANVNAVDNEGLTPLHIAVKHSNLCLVRKLLKYNANPNIKCNNSQIPLLIFVENMLAPHYHYNIFNPHNKYSKSVERDIFYALVEHGSDINIRYNDGRPLLLTISSEFEDSMIEKLLYYGADINMVDLSGKTCICDILEWEEKPNKEYMIDLYSKRFANIYVYVQKLLALGSHVSQKIQNVCTRILPLYNDYRDNKNLQKLENVFDKCINELDRMKKVTIDSYTSLYDILLKDPHELAKYVNNSNLINAFKAHMQFPLYGFLLQLQFNRGLKRSEVLRSSEAALQNVLNIYLPSLCYNLILKHLTNEEIIYLKEAAPVKLNLKRKLCENNSNEEELAARVQKKKIRK